MSPKRVMWWFVEPLFSELEAAWVLSYQDLAILNSNNHDHDHDNDNDNDSRFQQKRAAILLLYHSSAALCVVQHGSHAQHLCSNKLTLALVIAT